MKNLCYSNMAVAAQLSWLEQTVHTRQVGGSSPPAATIKWLVGQAVKTPPFHGGNTSSNLVRVTKTKSRRFCLLFCFIINPTDLNVSQDFFMLAKQVKNPQPKPKFFSAWSNLVRVTKTKSRHFCLLFCFIISIF